MSKDLVFIASGGRTGTNFFGEHLAKVIDHCWSEHEPDLLATDPALALPRLRKFGVWHMFLGRLLGITGLRVVGYRYMVGASDRKGTIRKLRSQRARYHASIEQDLIVESNFRYWMVAPILRDAFPGSRLVGMVRDPRSWVASWIRHRPLRHTTGFLGWFPQGPLTPADVDDEEWAGKWAELDQFGRLLWDWRIVTRQLDRAKALSGNTRLYRFEDVFGDGGQSMKDLLEFVTFEGKYMVGDLDGFLDHKSNASAGPRDDWQNWSDERIRLLDAICGEQMRIYGYGLEPEWQARLGK